ncbi:MAG: DUF2865 domain-containing protein [Pseudorhodoplanes sp.]|nr:MAG: DUF2865 domain-containing protein [Pseudorhodoplanes sp.]
MPGHRVRLLSVVAALLCLGIPGTAQAQGLFDLLFGGLRRATPPAAHAYADPGAVPGEPERERPAGDGGPVAAYCVRTCDGGFFPVERSAGVTAAELCKSFCPAAPTKVYVGAGIANAAASDGARYSELPTAYRYRDALVDGCSCKPEALGPKALGPKALGVKRLEAGTDPTLRPGDLVATANGLVAYRGSRRGVAEFTPVKTPTAVGERKLSSVRAQER